MKRRNFFGLIAGLVGAPFLTRSKEIHAISAAEMPPHGIADPDTFTHHSSGPMCDHVWEAYSPKPDFIPAYPRCIKCGTIDGYIIPKGYISQWTGSEPPPGWSWWDGLHSFNDPGHQHTLCPRYIMKL